MDASDFQAILALPLRSLMFYQNNDRVLPLKVGIVPSGDLGPLISNAEIWTALEQYKEYVENLDIFRMLGATDL